MRRKAFLALMRRQTLSLLRALDAAVAPVAAAVVEAVLEPVPAAAEVAPEAHPMAAHPAAEHLLHSNNWNVMRKRDGRFSAVPFFLHSYGGKQI